MAGRVTLPRPATHLPIGNDHQDVVLATRLHDDAHRLQTRHNTPHVKVPASVGNVRYRHMHRTATYMACLRHANITILLHP